MAENAPKYAFRDPKNTLKNMGMGHSPNVDGNTPSPYLILYSRCMRRLYSCAFALDLPPNPNPVSAFVNA